MQCIIIRSSKRFKDRFDHRYLIQLSSRQCARDICVGGFSYRPGAKVPFEKSGSIPRFSHGETVSDDCVPSHSQECMVRSRRGEDSRLRYCAQRRTRDGNDAAVRRGINSRLAGRLHRDDRDIAIETSPRIIIAHRANVIIS